MSDRANRTRVTARSKISYGRRTYKARSDIDDSLKARTDCYLDVAKHANTALCIQESHGPSGASSRRRGSLRRYRGTRTTYWRRRVVTRSKRPKTETNCDVNLICQKIPNAKWRGSARQHPQQHLASSGVRRRGDGDCTEWVSEAAAAIMRCMRMRRRVAQAEVHLETVSPGGLIHGMTGCHALECVLANGPMLQWCNGAAAGRWRTAKGCSRGRRGGAQPHRGPRSWCTAQRHVKKTKKKPRKPKRCQKQPSTA
jgi:hypothetical protein